MLHSFTHQLKQTASDIWAFLKNPKDQPAELDSNAYKWRILLIILVIDMVLMFALMGPIQMVEWLGWYTGNSHAIIESMRSMPVWAFLLMGVLVVPFLEELVFRYGLRFKNGYMALLAVAAAIALGVLAYNLFPLEGAIGTWVMLGMALVFYALNADTITRFWEKVWGKAYGVFFYLVALAFGLMHIINYTDFDYTSAVVLLIPILVAPQIVAGMLLGYMRVKYGFFWGFYLHAIHNALFFGLALATMGAMKEKLHIQNENYTLQVEERMLYDKPATAFRYTGTDSVVFENHKLHDVVLDLLDKKSSLVKFGKTKHQHTAINLTYKTHTAADISHNKQVVLAQLQELYKFDVTYRSQKQDAWDVSIADSSLLASNAVADIGKSTVLYNDEGITCENVTLGELVSAIETNFKVGLIARRKLLESGKYDIKLPKGDFSQTKEELEKKYGILLQSRMELADLAVVSFK